MDKQKPFACPDCGKPAKLEVTDILHMTINPTTGAVGFRARPVSDDCLYTGGDFQLWCDVCGHGREVTFDHEKRRITAIGDLFN